MDKAQLLRDRLNGIIESLKSSGDALALLGLGSVGADQMDAYSDLDFFVIVKPGAKQRYIDSIDWLERAAPVVFHYHNTVDSHRILFADGVFGEPAVFEPQELSDIPFAPGRILWAADGFDESVTTPKSTVNLPQPRSADFLLGEALASLYIGLSRYRRGERLSAFHHVQRQAVDSVVALASHVEAAQPARVDIYDASRRFEQRYPDVAAHLPTFLQGYARTVESARAILAFLEAHFDVNPAMKAAILMLAER